MKYSSGENLLVLSSTAIKRDYYIAIGLTYKDKYEFPDKKFFYCLNDFVFAELPELFQTHNEHTDKFNSYFTGDPLTVLVPLEKKEEEEKHDDEKKDELKKDDEEIEKPIPIPQKDFKEINRLSFVVKAIENDNHLVPEGAYKLNSIHEVRRNQNFNGLHMVDLINPKKYLHFRNAQLSDAKNVLKKVDAVYYSNFLDSIESDTPLGVWSMQIDNTGTKAQIKSFLWPGYAAYHIASTNKHSGVYIGNGIKNKDLAFML